MTPKEEFIEIYTKYITRNGAEELLEWLKRTDFFTAPEELIHIHSNLQLNNIYFS